MTSSDNGIGIDLGSTVSLIAVQQGAEVRPIAAANGVEGVPSVVCVDAAGAVLGINKVVVGHEALAHLFDDPGNTATGFIEDLGREIQYHFSSSDDPVGPEELTAEVLRTLRLMARWQLGHDIMAATLAVPVAFDASQRKALARAARLAGFSGIRLIEAPVAAAAAAALSAGPVPEGAVWLVYDWGGTTFEASLVRRHAHRFEVMASLGSRDLGGSVLDWAIVDDLLVPLLLEQYSLPDFTRDNARWAGAFGKLRVAAETARIELSSTGRATIAFEELCLDDDGAPVRFTYDLHGPGFEGLIDPYVDRTVAFAEGLLEEHGLSPDDLDRIVLVGGCCRTPQVLRGLEALGSAAAHGIDSSCDPVSIVACGAALLAGRPAKAGAAAVAITGAAATIPVAVTEAAVPDAVGPHAADAADPVGDAEPAEADEPAEPAEADERADDAEPAEAETPGQTETAAEAEPVEERPAGAPPAPPPLELYSNDLPRDAAVGILQADQSVEWVFEVAEAVPTPRRRVSYVTEADLQTGSGLTLRVPVVRGSGRARYSVIGAAVIAADELSADLPSGSKVTLGIKVDDEYRLEVSAYVPATKDVWDDVLRLGYAEAFPDEPPADEDNPVTPGAEDAAEGEEAEGEEDADEAPVAAAPAAPAEPVVGGADVSEPKAPEAPDEERGLPTPPAGLALPLEPSVKLADAPIARPSPADPEPDFAWIDMAGRQARLEQQVDEAQTVVATTTSAELGVEFGIADGAQGTRPSDGVADEEILRRARGYLLVNKFEEAAHEVGRLGNSETLLSEALDVLARVRLHQGHFDVARSLWIQADELNPGVKRYAEGLELVAEASGGGQRGGLSRRRTIQIAAVALAIALVVIVLAAYACGGGGTSATPAGGSPSPSPAAGAITSAATVWGGALDRTGSVEIVRIVRRSEVRSPVSRQSLPATGVVVCTRHGGLTAASPTRRPCS